MNYAWNIGASGVLTAMYRQDVAANNLANLETVGFKPDTAFTIPRRAARQEDSLYNLPSNALLERLGAGTFLAPTRPSFTQGAVSRTGNPLDVAIDGGGFLAVASEAKNGKGGGVRLTRDGRLTLDTQGQLVSATTKRPVLDSQDHPITLDPAAQVVIDGDGTVKQNDRAVAQLKFVDIPDHGSLRKDRSGLFAASRQTLAGATPATGRLVQGAVERSAVDPIQATMAVQNAANAVGTSVRVMQIQDEMMNRAINTFGRVSA